MKFADAKQHMIRYLESTEFSEREDAKTTISSISILISIIKKGYITTNSQEGLLIKGFNKDTRRFYHIEERAYVSGVMKHEDAVMYINWINTYTDKVALFIQPSDCKSFEKLFNEGDYSKVSTIPLTVSNSATTRTGIKTLYPDTRFPTVMPVSLVEFEIKKAHVNKSENVDFVLTFDPVYCRKATTIKGLYTDILRALNSI